MSSLQEIIKLNPFTNDVLYKMPQHSLMDIIKMIQTSNKVYLDWKTTTLDQRLTILKNIIANYKLKKNDIIDSESMDQGLSEDLTMRANFEVGLRILEAYQNEILQHQKNIHNHKQYQPNGVVSVILSWNLSNRLFIEKALSAVLAGNTVLVKVSSASPSLPNHWNDLLKKSGVPDGVVQFVVTSDAEAKKILVTHPGIKAVTATGTLQTCVQILKTQNTLADKQFKKIQLASGTKNSCLALDEPDAVTVNQVLETFLSGQGQLAWNSSRLFILEKHQAGWVEAINETLNKLRPAESPKDKSWWGPMVKSYEGLSYNELKKTAEQDQAKLIFSNYSDAKNNYMKPIFTYDMSNCSELQQDELHMPLYVLSAVKYGFDVPKYSNVSYYGHSAQIFSKAEPSIKIVSQLDVGAISVNQWSIFKDLSVHAVKQSAFGMQDRQIFGEFNSNVKVISLL